MITLRQLSGFFYIIFYALGWFSNSIKKRICDVSLWGEKRRRKRLIQFPVHVSVLSRVFLFRPGEFPDLVCSSHFMFGKASLSPPSIAIPSPLPSTYCSSGPLLAFLKSISYHYRPHISSTLFCFRHQVHYFFFVAKLVLVIFWRNVLIERYKWNTEKKLWLQNNLDWKVCWYKNAILLVINTKPCQ